MSAIKPSELRVSKDRRQLTVKFGENRAFEIPAEMLRVLSPSAEVQGHSPDQRKLVSGKRNVEIMQIKAVGNYAIRIAFDDLHETGIFTWNFLLDLGENLESKIVAYEKELAENGLSRD
ncbi:MAG: gamma-butyrobetaine hydroxylase-like domain-containing protein [Rhizobiaceae bacterium]